MCQLSNSFMQRQGNGRNKTTDKQIVCLEVYKNMTLIWVWTKGKGKT